MKMELIYCQTLSSKVNVSILLVLTYQKIILVNMDSKVSFMPLKALTVTN